MLPSFKCVHPDAQTLVMEYASIRRLSSFAMGLIQGCVEHFDEDIDIRMEEMPDGAAGEEQARFILTRK